VDVTDNMNAYLLKNYMENIAQYQKVCYNDRCKDICTYFIFLGGYV
jgi:hypothetical protein